ncbi:hypothetical protein C731_3502 [Mycolicibacterium hassiacum DSM 44199]|uniref:Uncharacterized protein n=1 Tax=Mycolicibacterium hassiacum (strain DSM 44199 / CIP 105218 / JCM 12690 / 3849) TaxID=1122247 RepID=K5BJ55_MYCHD|nr:hypothetical protein C731_3502 [Mycolicibacterium hassiacum DSM 44199]
MSSTVVGPEARGNFIGTRVRAPNRPPVDVFDLTRTLS